MTADPIDGGALRSLLEDMGGDAEVVRELIQSFLEEAPRILAQGREAAARGDAAAAQRAFHTLKGTAATFGATALSAQALAIEHAARAGALPHPEQVAAVAAALEAARRALLARLG